ncbi:MAG TPA: aspartyl protease family protein [Sphingobacteriaceae bacterium]
MLIKRSISFLLLLTTLLGCVSLQARADDEYWQFKDRRKKQVIPFKLIKNLMIIPMTINGNGPYNFVLDTGVGLCIITDPALVDTLKPKFVRDIRITGFGEGSDISATIATGMNFATGHVVAKNMSAAILKTDAFNLSAITGIDIHGLIGYEFFSSFIVKVNYLSKQLTIYRRNTAYLPRKGTKIPITIEERKPYVNAEIAMQTGEVISAKLIIDTGAGHPISLETHNGIPFTVPPLKITANLGIGLTGPIDGYLSRVKSIRLGKYKLDHVVAAFPDYQHVAAKISSISRNGNMGNSILKRFIVVFDYSRNAVYLRPNVSFKEPFEHDMSGMELISGGPDFNRIFILRIEPGSPADNIGLQKEDEIVSINFKRVQEMSMEEIDALFRSKDDRSLLLEVVPKGHDRSDRVILTLKRRI